MQNNISLEIHSASSGLQYMYNVLKFLVLKTSELVNRLIAKSQQLNQLYNSSSIDFSLTFSFGFNPLTYIASLISFCTTFVTTSEDFKIVCSCMGVMTFSSVF